MQALSCVCELPAFPTMKTSPPHFLCMVYLTSWKPQLQYFYTCHRAIKCIHGMCSKLAWQILFLSLPSHGYTNQYCWLAQQPQRKNVARMSRHLQQRAGVQATCLIISDSSNSSLIGCRLASGHPCSSVIALAHAPHPGASTLPLALWSVINGDHQSAIPAMNATGSLRLTFKNPPSFPV